MVATTRTLLGLDSGEWEALGVWVTAAVTLGLFIYAVRQLRDAREVRIEQARPAVIVDVAFRSIMIKLVVKNTGQTTATNVEVAFERVLESARFDLKWLQNPAFTEGIPSMAPGRTLEYLFDMFPDRIERGLPMEIRGTVSYDGPTKLKRPRYSESFVIDLEVHKDSLMADKSMHDLVERITDVHKEIKKWTSGSRGLYVESVDHDRQAIRSERPYHLRKANRLREESGWRAALGYFVERWQRRRGMHL